jgi:hypothetical protein
VSREETEQKIMNKRETKAVTDREKKHKSVRLGSSTERGTNRQERYAKIKRNHLCMLRNNGREE